jgi:hypothetical protein
VIRVDQESLEKELGACLEAPGCRQGLETLSGDPFFLAFFLMSVSQGEGLGEAAVGMIRQEEVAALIQGLRRQEEEERGHKESTRDTALALFPELFEADRYRYETALDGSSYYATVLEANRARLKERGCYSRLGLYLTTTFGYEVMVLLLYRAVAESVRASGLPTHVRDRVGRVLEEIVCEEETHLGVVDQHVALVAAERSALSPEARGMLLDLEHITEDDYVFAARLSVREVARMMARYADAAAWRRDIERQPIDPGN